MAAARGKGGIWARVRKRGSAGASFIGGKQGGEVAWEVGDGVPAGVDNDRCVSVRGRRRLVHDNGPVVKVGQRWAARGERKEREGEGKELGFGPALFFVFANSF